MRRPVVPILAAAVALAVAPAAAAPAAPAVHAVAAKHCSSSYTHGRINGVQKCLRVGEFCTHRFDHRAPHRYAYKHYGFACKKHDSYGYRLTYR